MKRLLIPAFVVLAAAFAHAAVDGPLTPEQAIPTFRLDPGLKIECVASEPMVVSPVAVAWDEQERMYVVEDRGYPIGPPKGEKPDGRVVLLESTHHDGHYDKRTVFADGLTFPNGIMPWKGGVFVTCAPYLYYFKDTNGDGVADVKQIVFKGFQDESTTQLRVSHPTLNVDNWIYLTSGLTSCKVSSPLYPQHPTVVCHYNDFRFMPDSDEFEACAGTAQFGQTFDNFGRKFVCSNRNHNQAVMMQLYYAHRNPDFSFSDLVDDIPDHGAASRVYAISADITTSPLHAGYFTSACGIFYFRGTALPAEYQDNSFTCEPAGNLVHRDVIIQTNSGFVATRAKDGVEFFASPDNWCRPVNLATGPDGALYLCDMYRKTIEHPEYLPEATRKITDFNSGKDMGRIYRISAKSEIKMKHVDLSHPTAKLLCDTLNHPDAWWRTTAQRLLLEKKDPAAVPYLKSLSLKAKLPETRVLALHLLDAFHALDDSQILGGLKNGLPGVRENAIQLAEPRLAESPKLAGRVLAMADDPNQRVRFQCALSLGELRDPKIVPALAKIASRDVADRWTRTAVLSAVSGRADELLHLLLSGTNKDSEGMSTMLVDLCRTLGAGLPDQKLSVLAEEVAAADTDRDVLWQEATLTGMAEGLHKRSDTNGGRASLSGLLAGESDTARQARSRVDYLTTRSTETLGKRSEPLSQRLIALRFLVQASSGNATATLQGLVDPQEPAEIQVAAIRALGSMGQPQYVTALLKKERWSTYSPPVKDAVLSGIMGKPELMKALLGSVASGDIPAWAINEDRRELLLNSKNEEIKSQATTLFKEMGAGDRMKVYEEYKSILALKPDPKNGHAIFTKTCTGCHMFGGEGHVVGPDLTGIRNQPKEVLLLHIVVPEYEIMPTYTCYNVETKDGMSYTGLLAAETPSAITLRQALGHEENIQRANIASMSASRLSLMPDELEKTMSKQDLADLLDFLKGM
jgi:putative membrane-bound dehydrogenase-like protein